MEMPQKISVNIEESKSMSGGCALIIVIVLELFLLFSLDKNMRRIVGLLEAEHSSAIRTEEVK